MSEKCGAVMHPLPEKHTEAIPGPHPKLMLKDLLYPYTAHRFITRRYISTSFNSKHPVI
ncbi:Uncharacterised protein [Serratia fonticola]|nr:Uncharacterised protein [Serratia fonticola]